MAFLPNSIFLSCWPVELHLLWAIVIVLAYSPEFDGKIPLLMIWVMEFRGSSLYHDQYRIMAMDRMLWYGCHPWSREPATCDSPQVLMVAIAVTLVCIEMYIFSFMFLFQGIFTLSRSSGNVLPAIWIIRGVSGNWKKRGRVFNELT